MMPALFQLDAVNDTARFINTTLPYIIIVLGLLIAIFLIYTFLEVGLVTYMLGHIRGWHGYRVGDYRPPRGFLGGDRRR
jgi:hypothetical protein